MRNEQPAGWGLEDGAVHVSASGNRSIWAVTGVASMACRSARKYTGLYFLFNTFEPPKNGKEAKKG